MPNRIPRRRQAPAPTKSQAAMSALTALMPSRTAAPVARSGRKRKSAGGLALLAGLGAAALKAKSRRAATPSA